MPQQRKDNADETDWAVDICFCKCEHAHTHTHTRTLSWQTCERSKKVARLKGVNNNKKNPKVQEDRCREKKKLQKSDAKSLLVYINYMWPGRRGREGFFFIFYLFGEGRVGREGEENYIFLLHVTETDQKTNTAATLSIAQVANTIRGGLISL